jgi:hypothetical protein
MGIEDLQFLRSHASKEEYIAVVDSTKRNKLQYPTPQEYVVEFDAPFENVYGIDVIDVNIPRSGYIIDTYNNQIYFRFEYLGSSVRNFVKGEVPVGNYGSTSAVSQEITDISDLIEAIEDALRDPSDELNNKLNPGYDPDNPDARRIRVEIVGAEDQTDPVVIAKAFRRNKKIRFRSPYAFAIDVRRSTLRSIIGLAGRSDETNFVSSNDEKRLPESTTILESPSNPTDFFPVLRNQYLIQTFVPSIQGSPVGTGNFQQITIVFGSIGTPPTGNGQVTLRIEEEFLNENEEMARTIVYQKDIPYASLIHASGTTKTIVFTGPDVSYQGEPVVIKKQVLYDIYIVDEGNDDLNNCWAVYHGQVSEPVEQNVMYKEELGERIRYYDPLHTMAVSIKSLVSGQAIEPEGIVDLFGERYIQLRCPEIEEHLHRNRAYERYNVGLAIVPTSLEYRNLSEKFVMLPSRMFHPIGRLKRMTFRFETSGGELYNFNGIDHTVTMIVRYYKVTEAEPLDAFVQNPHYRSNYLEYLHAHGMHDSEDDESDAGQDEYHPWP